MNHLPFKPVGWSAIALLACGLAGGMHPSCKQARAPGAPKAVIVRADGLLELTVTSFNLRYENSGDSGARAWRQRLVPVVQLVRTMNPDATGIRYPPTIFRSVLRFGFLAVEVQHHDRPGGGLINRPTSWNLSETHRHERQSPGCCSSRSMTR